MLELASLNFKRLNGLAVDVDDGVFDGWIFGLEVEVNAAERLLLVVAEE